MTDVVAERRNLVVDRFATPDAFRDCFKANYGPTIAAFRGIADDQEKVAGLDRDLSELAGRYLASGSRMDWEYLLFTARRA